MPMNFRLMRASAGGGPGPQPPEAPTSLTATADASSGEGRLTLNWTLGNNNGFAITNHNIQLSTDGGITWGASINTGSGTNFRVVSPLPLNTTYHVRVRSVSSAGNSDWSNIAGPATTPTVPDAVPNVTADTSETDISTAEITWGTPASDGGMTILFYEIFTSQDATEPRNWTFRGGSSGLTQPFLLTIPYRGGQQYTVDVRAVTAAGTGPSALMFGNAILSDSEPAAPQNLAVTPVAGADFYVAFDAPLITGDGTITDYEIEWGQVAGGKGISSTGNTNTYTLSAGLVNIGIDYEFRVRAINAIGNGEWSGWIQRTAANTPAADTFFSASLSSTAEHAVDLTSYIPSNNYSPILSYDIEVDDDSSFSTPLSLTNYTDQPSSGSFTKTLSSGLTAGVTYYFRIRYVNALGNGDWSPTRDATASNSVPDQIGDFAGNPDYSTNVSTNFNFTWSAPFMGNASLSQYEIVDENNNAYSTSINTGSSPITASWSMGASADTDYTFKVRAVNTVGNGPWSSILTLRWKSAPSSPQNLAATDLGGGSVEVEWDAPANESNAAPLLYTVSWSDNSWMTQTDYSNVASPYTIPYSFNPGTYDIRVRVQGDNTLNDPVTADTNVTVT